MRFIATEEEIAIDYAALDAPLDQMIWQHIAASHCLDDFRNYLKHSPEGSAHFDEAVERLLGAYKSRRSSADTTIIIC